MYYIFTAMTIYGLNALTRNHVNNFWDTSIPIYQTKSLVGTYTGPDAGRVNNYTCVDYCTVKLFTKHDLMYCGYCGD